MSAPKPEAPRDPWERFGWLMWCGWLFFLLFPLSTAVALDDPLGKVLGVGATLLFGAVYVVEVLRLTKDRDLGLAVPESTLALAALVTIAGASVPVIGAEGALSFVPFIQSFAVFGLRRPACWWFAGTGIALSAVVTWSLERSLSGMSFMFIVVGVTAAATAGRLLSEHGESYEAARRGQDVAEERERVARDVHDVLGHSLTVLTVKAELAQRLLDVDVERARAELADIASLSREALDEIRATVGGLRAARLDDEVAGARAALTDRGIQVDLPDDVRETDPRYRPVMGWVLREAVTNVVRHSDAQRCVVRLEERALSIEDDGRGLVGSREGNGLRGLRERVEQAGGQFVLEPREGGGTRLGVHW